MVSKRKLVALVGLVLLILFLIGCSKSGADTSSHIWYFHDNTHKVGIWTTDAAGKFGGRGIFVLPDSEFSNPELPLNLSK